MLVWYDSQYYFSWGTAPTITLPSVKWYVCDEYYRNSINCFLKDLDNLRRFFNKIVDNKCKMPPALIPALSIRIILPWLHLYFGILQCHYPFIIQNSWFCIGTMADLTKPAGANNIDGQAIAKSYTQLSGRPTSHPLMVHLLVLLCTATGGTVAANQTVQVVPHLLLSRARSQVRYPMVHYLIYGSRARTHPTERSRVQNNLVTYAPAANATD